VEENEDLSAVAASRMTRIFILTSLDNKEQIQAKMLENK